MSNRPSPETTPQTGGINSWIASNTRTAIFGLSLLAGGVALNACNSTVSQVKTSEQAGEQYVSGSNPAEVLKKAKELGEPSKIEFDEKTKELKVFIKPRVRTAYGADGRLRVIGTNFSEAKKEADRLGGVEKIEFIEQTKEFALVVKKSAPAAPVAPVATVPAPAAPAPAPRENGVTANLPDEPLAKSRALNTFGYSREGYYNRGSLVVVGKGTTPENAKLYAKSTIAAVLQTKQENIDYLGFGTPVQANNGLWYVAGKGKERTRTGVTVTIEKPAPCPANPDLTKEREFECYLEQKVKTAVKVLYERFLKRHPNLRGNLEITFKISDQIFLLVPKLTASVSPEVKQSFAKEISVVLKQAIFEDERLKNSKFADRHVRFNLPLSAN